MRGLAFFQSGHLDRGTTQVNYGRQAAGRYLTIVAPASVPPSTNVVPVISELVGARAPPQRHETELSFEMYGTRRSVAVLIAAFASLPYVIVMMPFATSTPVTYLPTVSVAVSDIPATVRFAGAVPRLRNVSATAAFAAAAKFMPSVTCARIV